MTKEQLQLTFVAPDQLARLQAKLAAAPRNPVDAYLDSLDSPQSQDTMRRQLRALVRVLSALSGVELSTDNPALFPWHRLRYEHTTALRAALVKQYQPPTINLQLTAMRGVLRAAWRMDLMTSDECERACAVDAVKHDTAPAGRRVPAGELAALFSACTDAGPAGARDQALLALLYGGGLRVSAAIAAEVRDYDPDTNVLLVRHAKGKKQRLVYFTDGGRAAIDAWLAVRRAAGIEPTGPIVCPVKKGGRIELRQMTRGAVNQRLVVLKKRANIGHVAPHDLRRTFVTDLLDRGADLSTVQRLAGHAHVSTTTRYDRRGEEAKQSAAELLHVPYAAPTSNE